MQFPIASMTNIASGVVGTTSNAQKNAASNPPTEAVTPTIMDVAELTNGNPDRDAQGQADGLPPKKQSGENRAEEKESQRSSSSPPLNPDGSPSLLDLW
ncbi:MAG: hypothetical protein RLY14_1484, partial [Planctomycetota bacterium]